MYPSSYLRPRVLRNNRTHVLQGATLQISVEAGSLERYRTA